MTWKMPSRNLDRYHKLIKYYLILKKGKSMTLMGSMDLNFKVPVTLISQMLIIFLKDFFKALDLIMNKIKIFSVIFLVEEIKMEKKDLVLVLDQCLITMICLKEVLVDLEA